MTRYDNYPDHPLFGVPQEVLDVARRVVLELRKAGHLTWGVDHQPVHHPPND